MTLALMLAMFVVAILMAMVAVPAIMRTALHKNLLDHPDGDRRLHSRAVPRLGGVAVFLGFLAALLFGLAADRLSGQFHSATTPSYVWRLMLACAILFCIGLADDIKGVRPALKLLGQILAALIVYQNGIEITQVTLPPGVQFSLGYFAMPVTILWLVGMSNAFNLIDGLDGLASGVGIIALVTIAAAGTIVGRPSVPVYAIALAGALVGFLRFNFPPARIFLGDSGSLVVGFLLAFLSVRGATRLDGVLYAIVPIFALAYPLLDTAIAMLRRSLRGDALSRADGRHIHHQLLSLLGANRALKLIYVASAGMAALGLCVAFGPPAMTTSVALLGLAALVLVIFYAMSWLDYHEFREAAFLVTSGPRRAKNVLRDSINARDVSVRIARASSLDELDDILLESAAFFRFTSMHLGDTSGHVATARGRAGTWRFEYPILVGWDDAMPRDTGEIPMLTIVCPVAGERPTGVERVVRVLAPAIGAWFSQRTLALHELKSRARSSAPVRQSSYLPPHLPEVHPDHDYDSFVQH